MSRARTTSGLRALPAMMRKELLQVRRDRRMLPITFVAPVAQLLILGYAANLDVVEVRVALVDRDRTPASRALGERVDAADLVRVVAREADEAAATSHLEAARADVVLTVPRGYGEDLAAGRPAAVHLTMDGSDSVAAGLGAASTSAVVLQTAAELARMRALAAGRPMPATIEVRPRVLYNETLTSRNFLVPAVLALILVVFTSLFTAMAIVREKEVGTMEQLIVTPISPAVLLLGKLLPFVLIGVVQSALVTAVAALWFRVPVRGSVVLLFALILLFVVNTLAIGLFSSTFARTQQQAMMTVMFFFLFPMMFLSGFVFPIENMPPFFQQLSRAVPLRYFLVIVRGIFLKGNGWAELWPQAAGLAVIGAGLFGAALLRFHKRLD